jgi:hypothetical protein
LFALAKQKVNCQFIGIHKKKEVAEAELVQIIDSSPSGQSCKTFVVS